MPNHAFLIMAHKSPELFGRIVKMLARPNHFFFVHIDAYTANFGVFKKAVSDIDNVVFTNGLNIPWLCPSNILRASIIQGCIELQHEDKLFSLD